MRWQDADPPSPGHIVPWAVAREGWEQRDFNLGEIPIRFAQDLFADQMPSCPRCGRLPHDQTWVCVDHDGSLGWLTICPACVVQVGHVIDAELTALRG